MLLESTCAIEHFLIPSIDLTDILSLDELEERARQSMSTMAYEFVAAGAADELSLRWNREAYDRLVLRPRVLRDVGTVDTSVVLFERRLPFPILLAPTAYHRVLHPEGELATAQGADAAQATWVVSTATTTAIEEIAAAMTTPWWFQLYLQSDKEFTTRLVRRAESAGCEALCLTVDTPVLGTRDRQTRAKFQLPEGVMTPHLYDIGRGKQEIMDPRRVVPTWNDVEWLRSLTKLPLLLKGILTGEDAARAADVGADGVIVSNHGARNLDTGPATIDTLREVVESAGDRVTILLDGGIRRGTDVIKALALGARAVLIGRPYCYGLAVGGPAGVARAVEILRRELETAMMLLGRASIDEIDASTLWTAPV